MSQSINCKSPTQIDLCRSRVFKKRSTHSLMLNKENKQWFYGSNYFMQNKYIAANTKYSKKISNIFWYIPMNTCTKYHIILEAGVLIN